MDQHRGDVTLGRCGNNHVHLCVVSKDGGRDELGVGEEVRADGQWESRHGGGAVVGVHTRAACTAVRAPHLDSTR